MDFESELTHKLLGQLTAVKSRRQPIKKQLALKIVKAISSFIKEDYNHSVRPNQNYVHFFEMFELCERWEEMPSFNEIDNRLMKMITGYLLKLCHFWWIDNLYVLNRVAQYYHKSHGEFREIIYGIADDNPTWKTLFTWGKWLFPTMHANYSDSSPLTYFLTCYNRYSFVIHGRSFVDQPLFSGNTSLSPCVDCFMNAEPDKLLLLLQFGASVSGTGSHSVVEELYCFSLLEEMVSSIRIDGENLDDVFPNDKRAVLSSDAAGRKLQCGRILIRVMPQIKKYKEYMNSRITINRLHTLHLLGYFPDVVRVFKNPWELKHLCRLSLRKLVHYTRMGGLPEGLLTLDLPKKLINYLNLLED